MLLQKLGAGLSSDEVVSAPDFTTPTAWDHLDGVISIATATKRTYLDRVKAAGKAFALASDEIEGFDFPLPGQREVGNDGVGQGNGKVPASSEMTSRRSSPA